MKNELLKNFLSFPSYCIDPKIFILFKSKANILILQTFNNFSNYKMYLNQSK